MIVRLLLLCKLGFYVWYGFFLVLVLVRFSLSYLTWVLSCFLTFEYACNMCIIIIDPWVTAVDAQSTTENWHEYKHIRITITFLLCDPLWDFNTKVEPWTPLTWFTTLVNYWLSTQFSSQHIIKFRTHNHNAQRTKTLSLVSRDSASWYQ